MARDQIEIAPITTAAINLVNEHLARLTAKSGIDSPHWLPYDPIKLANPPTVNSEGLSSEFDQPGWERWHIVLSKNLVVGHISLKGAKFDRGLHRCELGMGLELPYRRLGLGSKLIDIAIQQAQSIDFVDWLDLRVLSLNEPGINLYLKKGFSETSRIPDFCRIDNVPADDVFMSIDARV